MAVYIGTVPPIGWEQVWDKAAQRAGYTGPRPQVITDATELAGHGSDIGVLITKSVTPELLAAAPHLRLVQIPVSYTHLRAHETRHDLVCRLLLEKKKQ